MAAPTFVAASATVTADTSGGASTIPSVPTHQADDILIACAYNAASAAMSTATAGWTKIAGSAGDDFVWWWKRATGAGTAGPTITASGTDQFAICFVIRGCITTGTPYEDATVGNTGLTTTPQSAVIDTTGADRLAVCILNHDDDTVFSSGYPPATWTDSANVNTTSGTQNGFKILTKTIASTSTVAQVTIGTWSANEYQSSLTLAFIPSGPPTNTLQGSTTGTSAVSASLDIARTLAGTTTGTSSVTASLTNEVPSVALIGSTTGTSAVSASLLIARTLQGSTIGTSTVSGAALISRALEGLTVGTSDVSGNLSLTRTLAGASTGTSAVSGSVDILRTLAGATTGTSATATALGIARELNGSSIGTSAVSASLSIVRTLSGATTGTSAVSGTLGVVAVGTNALEGSTIGTSDVTGVLAIERTLTGAITGTSDASANLSLDRTLSGSITGTSDVAAEVGIERTLIGSTLGTSNVSVALTVFDSSAYVAIPPTYFTVSTGEMRIDVTSGELSIHTTTGKTYIDVG
jgi:hypothetical protein